MNNNQTIERLKQMRLGAMASLHYHQPDSLRMKKNIMEVWAVTD
jgi:hypothetical protein